MKTEDEMPEIDYKQLLQRVCKAYNLEAREEADNVKVYPVGHPKYCLLHSKGKHHGLYHPVCAFNFKRDLAECYREIVRSLIGHSIQDVSKAYPECFIDMPDSLTELRIKLDLLGV